MIEDPSSIVCDEKEGDLAPLVEQDTQDIEEISDIFNFVLPPRDILDRSSNLGVSYSRSVFEGWVKQPSACCGASSVAGSWNALLGLHRHHPDALNHEMVLDVYRDIMRKRIENKMSSFERKLGSKLDSEFWQDFEDACITHGKSICGKKGKRITIASVDSILQEMIMKRISLCPPKERDRFDDQRMRQEEAWEALLFLYGSEGIQVQSLPKDESKIVSTEEDDDEENVEQSDEEDSGQKTSANSAPLKWRWRTDFHDIVKAKSGLIKLGGEKPTTAPIGNWGILNAVEILSESRGLGSFITARLFMGKKKTSKSKVEVPLSSKDSADTIAAQWGLLKSIFMRVDHILLFHLTNHYALIFAVREWWNEDRQCSVRQLLTARRGQRPTAWIDFDEARSIMLGWEGYKIIAVSSRLDRQSLRNSYK